MAVINVEDAVRVFVVAITIASMIFFSIEYSRKRVGWEVLWVAFIEALNYTMSMTLPVEYLPVYGPYNMPMTRYISWMLTCPVLVKVHTRAYCGARARARARARACVCVCACVCV